MLKISLSPLGGLQQQLRSILEVFLYETSRESISLCSPDLERSFQIFKERFFLLNIKTPPPLLFLLLS